MMSESPKEMDGFKVCEFCDGEGRASRLPWSMEVGTCGTCLGSGVLPMRGYYFVTEDQPQIKSKQLADIKQELATAEAEVKRLREAVNWFRMTLSSIAEAETDFDSAAAYHRVLEMSLMLAQPLDGGVQ